MQSPVDCRVVGGGGRGFYGWQHLTWPCCASSRHRRRGVVHNILCLQLYVVFASFFNTIIGLLMKVSGEKCEKKIHTKKEMEKEKRNTVRKAGHKLFKKYFWQAAHFFLALERTTLKWICDCKKARKKAWIKWKKGSFRIKDLLAKCTRGASSRAQLPLGRVSIAPMT